MLEPAGSPKELMDRIRRHTEEYYAALLEQGHSEQAAMLMIEEEAGELALMLSSFMPTKQQERVRDMQEVQRDLKTRFMEESESTDNRAVLVTAVMLPTGAIETITNSSRLGDKVKYLREAYDDAFRLKVNPDVRIVGYMLV